jgi:hypothetical protein
MRHALVTIVILLACLSASPAQAVCEGIPPNRACEGTVLHYCLFGVEAQVDCAILGLVCGAESLAGDLTMMSCVPDTGQTEPCLYVDCGQGCSACGAGTTCNVYGECVVPATCQPDCLEGTGKQCGGDGCGGVCGLCSPVFVCTYEFICQALATCQSNCAGKQCGEDGCGGFCGFCAASEVCSANQQCEPSSSCVPDCAGKACGPDGCGGLCGECNPVTETCDLAAQCVPKESTCTPDCTAKSCGGAGPGGSRGDCDPGQTSNFDRTWDP